MDLLSNLAVGLHTALSLQNLLVAFFGVALGTLTGVLPGLGTTMTVAMLLPSVHALGAVPALIMLAGIYYGSQYGRSTAAMLSKMPGASGAALTAPDGHAMARQGRAGAALAAAALGSLFAGMVATLLVAVFAPPLTALAFGFGPWEYFALMVLGLVGVVVLASGSLIKSLAMIVLGLLLGQIGTDASSGVSRFGLGVPQLSNGIDFIALAIGLFAFAAIIAKLGKPAQHREVIARHANGLWPTKDDIRQAWPAVLRGTGLGSLLGVLPGGGSILAAFAARTLEKKIAKDRSRFDEGAIQSLAGPQSATIAGTQTSFIPMLALGIPANAVMALMIGAMTIKGIQPGPQVVTANAALFWALIASMWIGNLVAALLNLPLIGIWIRLLGVPYRLVLPAVLVFCGIGLFTLHHNSLDIYLAAGLGVLGYVFYLLACEPAPLLLGFILAPMMEDNLRRALLMARGDWSTFVTRPLSAGLLAGAAVLIVIAMLPSIKQQREVAFQEAAD